MILVENATPPEQPRPVRGVIGWRYIVSLTGHGLWNNPRFYQYLVATGQKQHQ